MLASTATLAAEFAITHTVAAVAAEMLSVFATM
jgi:hypothetical protein